MVGLEREADRLSVEADPLGELEGDAGAPGASTHVEAKGLAHQPPERNAAAAGEIGASWRERKRMPCHTTPKKPNTSSTLNGRFDGSRSGRKIARCRS